MKLCCHKFGGPCILVIDVVNIIICIRVVKTLDFHHAKSFISGHTGGKRCLGAK